MQKTCCLTGHRPNGLPWKYDENAPIFIAFKCNLSGIIYRLIRAGFRHFISGMEMGIDMIAAESVLKMKEKYNLTLEAALPCENQCKDWAESFKQRYNKILEKCDKITYISKEHTKECMRLRNCFMVDCSDFVVAVWNENKRSGTAQTINYAKKNHKRVLIMKI